MKLLKPGHIAVIAAAISFASCKKNNLQTQSEDSIDSGIYTDTVSTSQDGSGDTIYGGDKSSASRSIPRTAGSATQNGAAGSSTTSGSQTGTGAGDGATSGSSSSGSTSSGYSSGYGDSNDPLENSSSPSVNSKGEPVRSSGSSGSGMGTGTGSTGNNSRVTKKSDQLRE